METTTVRTLRGPFIGALAAARLQVEPNGSAFARRVNDAAAADPTLGPGRWSRMNVSNQERDRSPVRESLVRRYAAGLSVPGAEVEAVIVLVPKGATRVIVDIGDPPPAAAPSTDLGPSLLARRGGAWLRGKGWVQDGAKWSKDGTKPLTMKRAIAAQVAVDAVS